jgi:hypothetical protein
LERQLRHITLCIRELEKKSPPPSMSYICELCAQKDFQLHFFFLADTKIV